MFTLFVFAIAIRIIIIIMLEQKVLIDSHLILTLTVALKKDN